MNDKKRIAILINSSSGLYSFRRELLETLVKSHEVYILASDTGRIEELKAIGCAYIPVEMEFHGTNPLKELRLLRFYKEQLRQIAPDMVLSYTIKPNVYGGLAAAALKIPCVANITGLGDAIENPGLLSAFTRRLYRFGLKKDVKVFFQNQANRDFFLRNGLYRGENELLPGSGVNLERYTVSSYPPQKAGDKLILTVVGRITRDKGFFEILKAAEALRGEPVLFRFIGNCMPELEEAMKAAEAGGNVRYYGLQKDVSQWYADTHAVLHASYHEGMSNVLLEAAASGRPVLASNVPGCRETFEEGVSGFGFPPKDPEAIVSVIRRFAALSDERREAMGLAGRRLVEASFDRNRIVNKYLEAIDKWSLRK